MDITLDKTDPAALGAFLFAESMKSIGNISAIEWGTENAISTSGKKISVRGSNIIKSIAKLCNESLYYGANPEKKAEIDSWLTFCHGPLAKVADFNSGIQFLNRMLTPVTYLTAERVTIADYYVYATLRLSDNWKKLVAKNEVPTHVLRWYNHVNALPTIKKAIDSLPSEIKAVLESDSTSKRKTASRGGNATVERAQEGKFIELPGAEMGKVVVRFPPEASGYLHIGHAKAALLNQYYQQAFKGKLIMRFDDTNPAKENVHFEQVILEDLEMLDIKPDVFTHTSQYFDLMLDYCSKMLKDGTAYVDDTSAELMKEQREQRIESVNRNNSWEKNNAMWQEMLKGSEAGQKCCVRANIDMQSPNGCLRDPTIYRCKNEPHPRTGTQYKVYPTYDFACPIVDAIENVTHTLRTMEYHDRDPQFYWFIDALGLRKPHIWEYSRLSMTNSVLSKRKLTWFVEQSLVDGWDDARMPTVRGVLRHGMTVEGLRQFIIAQGSSRSVVFMEWDKIWAFNKKVIDPIAPRYTAVEADAYVNVIVKGAKEEKTSVAVHPKNADIGSKDVWVGPNILIETVDAEELKEGENATFINWGNLTIKKINRQNGKVTLVEAEPNLENKDYKKTLKLTWLAQTEKAQFTPTWCVYYDHLISKPLLGKDEDFKDFINKDTKKEVKMLGDPELRKLKKGDIIQLQRKGFFRVDEPYKPISEFTTVEQPIVLFYIPDGHTKAAASGGAVREPSPPKKVSGANADDLNKSIIAQGDLVRKLKSEKKEKVVIDEAVRKLLTLKTDYKAQSGKDWSPSTAVPSATNPSKQPAPAASHDSSGAEAIAAKIAAQGDKVRQFKGEKKDKAAIDEEVKKLLALKAEYKAQSGKDWSPSSAVAAAGSKNSKQTPPATVVSQQSSSSGDEISTKIAAQGEKVRQVKAEKKDKATIDAEVKILLALKAEYKAQTGKDWKPGAPTPPSAGTVTEADILDKIAAQGDKIRQLKTDKADKSVITAEVATLLALKTDYKAITGKDWKPGVQVSQVKAVAQVTSPPPMGDTLIPPPVEGESNATEISNKITAQGEKVRQLKTDKADKAVIGAEVAVLLALKADFKSATGSDWKPAVETTTARSKSKEAAPKVVKQKNVPKPKPVEENGAEGGSKKQTRLGLEAKKEESLSDWYSQVITKGELIEYYDVSGCYILRPWSFAIWEVIRDWFDGEIKKLGVKNCYFPIFVSKAVLEKEKSHIADFSPEVAWVTKSGDSDMAEPIAIRPTSETVMYPAYAKWIQSYRDLPIKLNQWNNVVRWEFKHPQPFLRTREFLWQEGHTAYADAEDAHQEVKTILDLYARIYTDLLAIPVVKGRKTEKEKFAGGDYTYTVEAFVSASGRAIQGATSHFLGQNFSKIFDIVYEDPQTQEKKYVYQNSWGVTTRTIGVSIMVHADNQGLVLPPRVASVQIVIVTCGITANLSEANRKELQSSCDALEAELAAGNIKVQGDYRDNYSPGWKFNHWELKGVPIRVELGPKDIKNKQLVAVRRDTGEKITIKRENALKELLQLLDNIQTSLYKKAEQDLISHTVTLTKWDTFTANLDNKNIILAPFCGEIECEDKIKADSTRDDSEAVEPGAPSMGAKSLCIPLEQPTEIKPTDKCIHPACSRKPTAYTLFGRSY